MINLTSLSPHSRRNLLVLFASALLFWFSLGSLLPTLPLYMKEIGGTDRQIGLVIGSFALGMLVSRPWLGQLADRNGRKIVLLLAMGLAAIAPFGYLLFNSIPFLIAIRAFHGISLAALATAYLALVADLSPPENRGELISYMTLVNPIGTAVGPALGSFIQESVGYIPLFIIASGFAFLGFLCMAQIQEKWERKDRENDVGRSPQKFWGLLWTRRIGIPTAIVLIMGVAFGSLHIFIPLLIKDAEVNFQAGWFYTAAAIAGFCNRLIVGRLSDRFGRGLFITTGFLLYAVAMFILQTNQYAIGFLLAGTLEGAGAGLIIPTISAMIADRSENHERGRVFGLWMGGFDVGMAIAGPVAGEIAQQLGDRQVFAFATGIACLALLVFMTQSNKTIDRSFKYALGSQKDSYAVKTYQQPS